MRFLKDFNIWFSDKPNIRNSNPDELLTSEERTPEAILSRFKNNISDQIGLAVNLTSSLDLQNIENKIENYNQTLKAFSFTLDAVAKLGALLDMSPDFKHYQGDDYSLVSRSRIEDHINIADSITQKISEFWEKNDYIIDNEKDIRDIKLLIDNVKKRLNLNLTN